MDKDFEEFCVGQMKPVIPITGGKEGILSKNPVTEQINEEYNALDLSMANENDSEEGDPPTPEPDEEMEEVKESVEEKVAFESAEEEDWTTYLESDTKIDDDIKPIIDKLNDKGYETKYSCSGHPSARVKKDVFRDGVYKDKLYSTARIVFAKNYDIGSAPKYWTKKTLNDGELTSLYVVPPTFKIVDGLPKDAFSKWKQKYMESLEKWVDELPKQGEKKEDNTEEVVESVLDDLLIDVM